MKKKLLSLFFLLAAFLQIPKVNAQDFNYNVATAAITAAGSFTGVTQNGITLSSTAAVAADGTDYKYLNLNGSGLDIVLTSSVDIKQVTLVFRGSNASSAGTPVVTYGASSGGTLSTYGVTSATGNAPGSPVQYDFPEGTKYIKVIRNATVRIYRVAASATAFTLPLNFLSFTAKPDAFGKTVAVNWSTTNEVNTKNFEIQKRKDTGDFATIGYLNSKNTSGIHNYSFADNNASAGNSYYRIVQFDNDGASKSSDVVAVSATGNNSLSVYPNPVDQALNINHALSNSGSSFKILSSNGATVSSSAATANSTSTSINVSDLTPGAYVLVFDNKTDSKSIKFVKK